MLTETGHPFFKAPEIIEGGGYDLKVDIWSLGVVLYFMISGILPFNDEYTEDLMKRICENN